MVNLQAEIQPPDLDARLLAKLGHWIAHTEPTLDIESP